MGVHRGVDVCTHSTVSGSLICPDYETESRIISTGRGQRGASALLVCSAIRQPGHRALTRNGPLFPRAQGRVHRRAVAHAYELFWRRGVSVRQPGLHHVRVIRGARLWFWVQSV